MNESSWERDAQGDQTLEANWLFTLRRERFRSRRSGKVHDYYVMHLADAVHVIALTPERRVVLVRQFRAGSGRDSLETPGGLVDAGEDPCEAGARELLEETGYTGDTPIVLGTVWSVPSILTSRLTTILIPNARKVAGPTPDHHEEVEVELVPAGRIPALIREGRIDHALPVVGLLWWLASELPESPLAVPEPPPPAGRRWQTRLGAIMGLVAVAAVMLWLLRVAGRRTALGVALAVAFPLGAWGATLLTQPAARPILLRGHRSSLRFLVARLLAGVGLATLIFLVEMYLIFFIVNAGWLRFLM